MVAARPSVASGSCGSHEWRTRIVGTPSSPAPASESSSAAAVDPAVDEDARVDRRAERSGLLGGHHDLAAAGGRVVGDEPDRERDERTARRDELDDVAGPGAVQPGRGGAEHDAPSRPGRTPCGPSRRRARRGASRSRSSAPATGRHRGRWPGAPRPRRGTARCIPTVNPRVTVAGLPATPRAAIARSRTLADERAALVDGDEVARLLDHGRDRRGLRRALDRRRAQRRAGGRRAAGPDGGQRGDRAGGGEDRPAGAPSPPGRCEHGGEGTTEGGRRTGAVHGERTRTGRRRHGTVLPL